MALDHQKMIITGGTGFVGRHVQEELDRRGIEYVAPSSSVCDLTDVEQTEALFDAYRDAGVILHLASYQAAGDFPAKHPAEQFHINNLIHINVLDAWRKFLPHAKLFGIGTCCGYPSRGPLIEEEFMNGEIHGSVYSYAFTKRLLYRGITAYNDQYNLNGSYLIPATMYGEYDDFHLETAHVCGALIGKFVRAVREGLREVDIWGDGSQVREFMYVKDFVAALLHLIPLCDRDIVNVGPGKGTAIKALACAIKEAAGFKRKLFFNSDRYVGIKEKFMDASKLLRKYRWQVTSDLSVGIQRTVEWYAGHYDELKDTRKFQSQNRTHDPRVAVAAGV